MTPPETKFVVEVEEGGRFQPGGREEGVVGEDRFRRPPGEDAPPFHEHDRVGPAVGEFDVVGGYEHRPAGRGEFVEEFHHLLGTCGGVEGVRRFVEERTAGSIARMPAMATRFFSPPER